MKAQMNFDEKIKEYYIDLNGEPYEGLVYLDPEFNPDGKELKLICAKVLINDKEILSNTTQEWQPSALQHAIYSQIGDEESIFSIEVIDVSNTKAAVMNELIGLLAIQQNI